MAEERFRGPDQNQEIDTRKYWRDPRTLQQKFSDNMGDPNYFITLMGCLMSLYFVFPALGEFYTVIGAWLIWFASKKEFRLPFRIPKTSGLADPGQPDPGNGRPSPAEGIAFFGNEKKTKKELWFNNSDMRTHILIFGSTGAGKALRNDELIHTPKGWVKNKNLKVGDTVSTPFGSCPVIGVYPQGELELFNIKFEDGREIEISGEHLWEVHHKTWKKVTLEGGLKANAKVLTTTELIKEMKNDNFFDFEIILSNEVYKNCSNLNVNFYDFHKSNPTSISQEYKDSSVQQRYSLIQGFMDQQAIKDKLQFKTTHLQLAKDFSEIIYSLGGIACFSQDEINSNYIVNIRHPNVSKLFSLKEKIEKASFIKNDSNLKLKIKSITQSNKVEHCQCIKIADKRGLFITKDYIVTHNTEALLSLGYNALVQGSGLIYVDGKGENVLFTKVFAMARTMGREDDILVINYMTGAKDVFGPQEKKLSNTLNPFANGSSGGLTELMVSLMDGGDGGGDMWKGRAISLISAIMMALVYMRDQKEILLDVEAIREFLILDNIIKLYKTRRDFPNHIRNALRAYLVSLPGYQESAPKQNDTVLEQHGYLQMQFTKLLGSLSDIYGFIFKTNLGEVDFKDVVLNRRILVVLLPALEKSTDELANLGKIIVACLKQMMAAALGATIEGTYADVVETKPTNSEMPFMTILDKYGYYAVKGSAVMPAQARSLGFSMIFAGQDLPAFEKASKEEAASIIANCNIKICMKLEDPKDTFELFNKSADEAFVSEVQVLEMQTGGMATTFKPGTNASISKKNRINLLDLKDQEAGDAHILFKSAVIRAKMFYASPPKPPHIRMNYFVRVEPPALQDITEMDNSLKSLIKNLTNPTKIKELEEGLEFDNQNIEKMRELLDKHASLNNNEASFATVAALGSEVFDNYDEKISHFKEQLENDDDEDDDDDDSIGIFSNDKERDQFLKERSKQTKPDDDEIEFEDDDDLNVFMEEEETRKGFENIEKMVGSSDDDAREASERAIDDMKKISKYPSGGMPSTKEPEEITDILHELDEMFDMEDEDENEGDD